MVHNFLDVCGTDGFRYQRMESAQSSAPRVWWGQRDRTAVGMCRALALSISLEPRTDRKDIGANRGRPAICADVFSVCSWLEGDRKRQSTTHADSSSIPLSPPNARSAGLCALHALIPETISSTNIQKIVNH